MTALATPRSVPKARGLPIVGALPYVVLDPFGFCMRAAAEGDGLVRLDVGPVKAYLVSDPALVRHVLVGNAGNYVKGSMMDGIRLSLGNGLFTSDGDFWRRQRRLMQPAFHQSQIQRMSATVDEAVADAIARWATSAEAGEPIDLLAETSHVNIRIVLGALFGATVDAERSARLLDLTDRVFRGMAERVWAFFVPTWMPTPGGRRYRRAIEALDSEIYRVLAERRASPEQDDLLGMLLAAQDADTGERMTDRQLRDEIFTIFVAGYESTATATTWLWYLLARNPAVVERLHAELAAVVGDRAPTTADLPDLPYLRRVVDEAFRHYPAFPMYFRESVAEDALGDYRLPGGANVVVCPYATHHDPRYWDDPERFDPDRFTRERFDARARNAYYPFGYGQRRCIGEPMSLAIARALTAALAHAYDVRVAPGLDVRHHYAMTLQPKGGLSVHLTARR